MFGIRAEAGTIFLTGELDYETTGAFLLSVVASDRGPDSLESHASVLIRVEDTNDNIPLITTTTLSSDRRSAAVSEDSHPGAFVAYVSVIDRDSGDNGRVFCLLDGDGAGETNDGDAFCPRSVEEATEFLISTAVSFDREERDSYLLTITCSDRGIPRRSSAVELSIKVVDVNDNGPRFSKDEGYEATVVETSVVGLSLVRVSATDDDDGPNAAVSYWILDPNASRMFEIDHATGQVSNLVALDREETDRWEFLVTAMDRGLPVRSAEALVRLKVSDLDDEQPRFEQDRYLFEVRENRPPGFQVGQVVAKDRDSTPFNQLVYSLDAEIQTLEIFDVDVITGVIVARQTLDRESVQSFHFPVLATSGNFTATTQITVQIADVNDNRPVFVFPSSGTEDRIVVSSASPIGLRVARLRAEDPDAGENASLTYCISGGSARGLFSVDPSSGILAVRRSLRPFVGRTGLLLKVTVKDGGYPQMTDSAELGISVSTAADDGGAIEDAAVTMATDGLPIVVLATALSIAVVSAVGVVVSVCVVRWRRPLTRDLYKNSSSASSVIYHEVRRTRVKDDDDDNDPVGPLPRQNPASEENETQRNNTRSQSKNILRQNDHSSSDKGFVPRVRGREPTMSDCIGDGHTFGDKCIN